VNAATPLTLAALGGVVSERSGVVNIALEGMMLMSAFTGYVVAFQTHNLWLGVLAGVITGVVIASLHAALSINLMVDQIVSGFVINILALGITGVFFKGFLQESSVAGPGVLPWQPEAGRHRGRNQVKVAQAAQLGEAHAVGEPLADQGGGAQRDARLADAGRAGHRHQPYRPKQAGQRAELAAPADKAGRFAGQFTGKPLH